MSEIFGKSVTGRRVVLRFFPIIFFSILAALFFCDCARETKGRILQTPFEIVDFLGNKRNYRIFFPPRAGDKSLPLLVYFHGVWSNEFSQKVPVLKNYTSSPIEETGLIELSRKKGFVLLVPEAFYEFKSLRNCTAKGWKMDEEIDGIEKIIDKVAAEYPVSIEKIYLTGISAGAVLCHHLANKRPYYYAAVLSHSQAFTNKEGKGKVQKPAVKGPQFGVLFAYNEGDYPDLIKYCGKSFQLYKEAGYRTELLKNVPPRGHTWSAQSNNRFWSLLQKLSRKPGDHKNIKGQ